MNSALHLIITRNQFYQSSKRSLVIFGAVSILLFAGLVSCLIYLINNPPKPVYFAISSEGKLSVIYPLDQPSASDEAILNWAGKSAMAAFSYSYQNYRQELQASSGFFTADGWRLFMKALSDSNNLIAVKDKKWVVSAEMEQPPTILNKAIINGVYTWLISMKMLVTYQNDAEYTQQQIQVDLKIERVSLLNSPFGVGIAQFVVTPILK
jgi:intracellular multiplication protein IcmL